jgi:hypothetical protein
MQNLASLTHVLSWRSNNVLYDIHSARDTDGNESVVINALGPGGRHRYAVVESDPGHADDLTSWIEWDDDVRTLRAEAALAMNGGR